MRLRFVRGKEPKSAEELTEIEREQLVAAGEAWDGRNLSAEDRLSEEGEDEYSFLGFLYIWDIVDEDQDDKHVYTMFHYMVDSGCFFRAGSTEYDADIIQFYLHNPSSLVLAAALAEAVDKQREELGHATFRVSLD